MIKNSKCVKKSLRFSSVLPAATIASAVLAAALFAVLCIFPDTGGKAQSSGHIRLSVFDAYTLKPVKNVKIVIPDCDVGAVTDEAGTATLYSVSFLAMEAVTDESGEVAAGTVTLLAYHDDYYPYALFYTRIYENRVRTAPALYLFQKGTEEGISVTSFVESPNDEYIEKLVRENAPTQ